MGRTHKLMDADPKSPLQEGRPSAFHAASCYASSCGRVTLYLGDAFDILPLDADAVISDPPYGITQCEWDDKISMETLWEKLPKTTTCLFASQPFTTRLIGSNLMEFGYCWTWVKNRPTGHLNAKRRPMMATEDVVVFRPASFNPQMTPRTEAELKRLPHRSNTNPLGCNTYGDHERGEWNRTANALKMPHNVLSFEVCDTQGKNARVHPTQKPVPLMRYLIRTYTNNGETVLDPFMGSGSTGVAAIIEGRRFIGIERDPVHYATAVERIRREIEGDLFHSQHNA